jgi:hypothetical protein
LCITKHFAIWLFTIQIILLYFPDPMRWARYIYYATWLRRLQNREKKYKMKLLGMTMNNESWVNIHTLSIGNRRFVSRKCPMWFTPICISRPSIVRHNGIACGEECEWVGLD